MQLLMSVNQCHEVETLSLWKYIGRNMALKPIKGGLILDDSFL